jgi:hypothetical protein
VMIGLRHTYAVAKEKLIPERPESDRRDPHKRFSDFAQKIVTVPKSEIDEREERWQRERKKSR